MKTPTKYNINKGLFFNGSNDINHKFHVRIFCFYVGKHVCESSKTCTWDDGIVMSETTMIDVEMDKEVAEIWNIHAKEKHYIHLSFTMFDIGCKSGSTLELVFSAIEKHTLCNTNKPIAGLNSTNNIVRIYFKFVKKANRLTEGFTAEYTSRKVPMLHKRLITFEDTGNHHKENLPIQYTDF